MIHVIYSIGWSVQESTDEKKRQLRIEMVLEKKTN